MQSGTWAGDDGRVVVRNATRGCVLAMRAEVARGPIRRAIGLIGRGDWAACDGLLLDPCNGIHTFFMALPIDVVLVDRGGRVVRTARAVKPWRAGPMAWRAGWALELPPGTVERTGTAPGDLLEVARQIA